jgi:hypothetical protein
VRAVRGVRFAPRLADRSTDLVEDSVLGYKFTAAGLAATKTLGLA